jgi:hypothetical protein
MELIPNPSDVVAERVSTRTAAWNMASELVEPIVDRHGLEKYSTGPNIFAQTFKTTCVDQHIDHIMRVADWLLER